jgi:quercetin dioxygenase-like cupin family protein
MTHRPTTHVELTTLSDVRLPALPGPADVMTVLVELPPGDPGSPPHRHPGPVFGYVLEGAVRFHLEGREPQVLGVGETLWEPGGDVVHLEAANALPDAWTRFVAVMMGAPGAPMLTPVETAAG